MAAGPTSPRGVGAGRVGRWRNPGCPGRTKQGRRADPGRHHPLGVVGAAASVTATVMGRSRAVWLWRRARGCRTSGTDRRVVLTLPSGSPGNRDQLTPRTASTWRPGARGALGGSDRTPRPSTGGDSANWGMDGLTSVDTVVGQGAAPQPPAPSDAIRVITRTGWAGMSMATPTRAWSAAGTGKWTASGRNRIIRPSATRPPGPRAPETSLPEPGAAWWGPVVVAAGACAGAAVGYRVGTRRTTSAAAGMGRG